MVDLFERVQSPEPAAPTAPPAQIEHPFAHFCDFPGCTNWGGFGFGVSLRRNQRGYWACFDPRHIAFAKEAA